MLATDLPPDVERDIVWDEALLISEVLETLTWPNDLSAALRLGGKLRLLQKYYPTKAAMFDAAFLQGLGQKRHQLEDCLWLARMVHNAADAVGDHISANADSVNVWDLCGRLRRAQAPENSNVVDLFPRREGGTKLRAKSELRARVDRLPSAV